MKLLLDQNLSRRLLRDIDTAFPGSQHVADFKLTAEDDEIVWRFAGDHGFVMISKDSDFFHRALLRGHPPKVIHLRAGNCSTPHLRKLLLDNATLIYEFISHSETGNRTAFRLAWASTTYSGYTVTICHLLVKRLHATNYNHN